MSRSRNCTFPYVEVYNGLAGHDKYLERMAGWEQPATIRDPYKALPDCTQP
jgi:hypothetical protein